MRVSVVHFIPSAPLTGCHGICQNIVKIKKESLCFWPFYAPGLVVVIFHRRVGLRDCQIEWFSSSSSHQPQHRHHLFRWRGLLLKCRFIGASRYLAVWCLERWSRNVEWRLCFEDRWINNHPSICSFMCGKWHSPWDQNRWDWDHPYRLIVV